MKNPVLPFLLLIFLGPAIGFSQQVIYVNAAAGCPGIGTSWASAFCHLQSALDNATAGSQIWVARGTYTPDLGPNVSPGDQNASFLLKNGVQILGGFAGNENLATQRDWEANPTLLSGRLSGTNNRSNTVVRGTNVDHTAILDGFIIEHGEASTSGSWSSPNSSGANMHLSNSSPVIRDCIIRHGRASYGGGVTMVSNSSPTFQGVEFNNNSSSVHGGAIHIRGNCNPFFEGCTFENNHTNGHGGAIHCRNNNHPEFLWCTFENNSSGMTAGAVVIQFGSTGEFRHCHFYNNHASQSAGAVHFNGNSGGYFFNCHFEENHALGNGGALGNHDSSNSEVESSFFRSNSAQGSGGALRNTANSEISITSSYFTNNSSDGEGGAIWNSNNSKATLFSGVSISRNSSKTAGGGVANMNHSQLLFDNGTVSENTASQGGGVFSSQDSQLDLLTIFFLNNEANEGGAVFLRQNRAIPTNLRYCTFNDNTAGPAGKGGAIFSDRSWPVLISESAFNRNMATSGYGGALYFTNEGSGKIEYSNFFNNEAQTGGAVKSYNGPDELDFLNCVMSGNSASENGGAIALNRSVIHLTNNLISGNKSLKGAAYFLRNEASALILNTTAAGNLATETAGGVYLENQSEITLQNSILFGNTADGSHDEIVSTAGSQFRAYFSCISNQSDQTGGQGIVYFDPNTTFDNPNFADPEISVQAPFTSGDFRLLAPSPAIDEGNNQFISGVNIDLDLNDRIINETVDMGAYERAQCFKEVNVYLCPEKSWNGMYFTSDTVLMELLPGSAICDSVLVTYINLVEPLQPLLENSEDDCLFDSTSISVLNFDSFTELFWSNGDSGPSTFVFESGIYEIYTVDTNGCEFIMETEIRVTPPLAISLEDTVIQTNPITPDGSISVSASGGYPPYTFQWDNGSSDSIVSGLSGGLHCLTVTDAQGCEAENCFFLDATFEILSFEVTVHNILCPGDSTGRIEMILTGGYPTFEVAIESEHLAETVFLTKKDTAIEWYGLPVGDYTIKMVDSIGQIKEITISMEEPSPFDLSYWEIENPSCHGGKNGSIEVITNGGTPPYQLQWEPQPQETTIEEHKIFGLTAGIYTLIVTDSFDCFFGPFEFILSEPDSIIPHIEFQYPLCQGVNDGWIEISEVGGGTPPFDVVIEPEQAGPLPYFVQGLSPGIFPLEIEDSAGCRWRDTVRFNFLENYQLNLSAIRLIELGDTIPIEVFTNMPDIDHFFWTPTESITFQTGNPLDPLAFPVEGTEYKLTILNAAGCILSDSIKIEVIPSREEVYIPNAFSPNYDGINDYFTVFAGIDVGEIEELIIFNRWGSVVWRNSNFQPNRPELGWDGYFRGKKLQGGIYVYIANILFKNGVSKQFSGEFLLIE